MPSLSALKMLVTIAVTFQLPDAGKAVKEAYRKRRLLGFLDVKRAHFYSDATREIYVELPAEAKKPGEDVVGRLLKSLYGTRDAPLNWELQIQKVMLALGFKQGKSIIHAFTTMQAETSELLYMEMILQQPEHLITSNGFMKSCQRSGNVWNVVF